MRADFSWIDTVVKEQYWVTQRHGLSEFRKVLDNNAWLHKENELTRCSQDPPSTLCSSLWQFYMRTKGLETLHKVRCKADFLFIDNKDGLRDGEQRSFAYFSSDWKYRWPVDLHLMQMKIDLMNPDDDLWDACIRKRDNLPEKSKWNCFQIFLQFLQICVNLLKFARKEFGRIQASF